MLRTLATLPMLALCVACGESQPTDAAPDPISGSALDAVQVRLQEILDREFEDVAEQVRVERADSGQRAVVHATLRRALREVEYQQVCAALSEAASPVLEEGQSMELYLLRAGSVVHTCGL